MVKTVSETARWQDHQTCTWTWPSAHGVTGCEDCQVVFPTPTPDEAWTIMPAHWMRSR